MTSPWALRLLSLPPRARSGVGGCKFPILISMNDEGCDTTGIFKPNSMDHLSDNGLPYVWLKLDGLVKVLISTVMYHGVLLQTSECHGYHFIFRLIYLLCSCSTLWVC
ncbi:MAG: hypothetical protein NXY57DRAFT_316268 [Lentinula lateritia]|nr:MAG: hypothetical protein NXY57DRAFT_316268 [Lentinula lateritia]